MKLTNRDELVSLREKCREAAASEKKRILVCTDNGCLASGAMDVYEAFRHELAASGLSWSVELTRDDHDIGLKRSGCHGLCELSVLVRIEPDGYQYFKVKPEDCPEIVGTSVKGNGPVERLSHTVDGVPTHRQDDMPFYKKQNRLVLEHCGYIDANSILEYLSVGGYSAFERALFDMTPDEIVREVNESNLRGRGGGGFKTGRKWEQVKRQTAAKKYVVCNGDEGDPGAFMDSSIMGSDPHRVLEGMMIAGLACGSDEAYIYVRAEYPLAVTRLKKAIAEAEEYGLLGDEILGSGFSYRIRINRGAGAFVCGEGSALTASIEGKRGMPRTKPPRTVEHGLFDKPTVLNNVETFASVPVIIEHGADFYRSIGPENSPGTKTYSLTGNVLNTGLIEVPMGMTLRDVIFDVGGGMRGGTKFKAVQIGGPSGGCLTKDHLDLPMDFDSLKKVGAMVGSGGLVIMDTDTCMVEVARFFMNFTQKESCGKCIPCREGTKRMLAVLERIADGRGEDGDIDLLLEIGDLITNTSLCGLGKSAAGPVISTIKYFRDEYEAHIKEKRCPAGSCKKLTRISIATAKCKGCSKCSKACPVGAVSGKIKEPFTIDTSKCVKCEACVGACPFGAILKG
jgi:NADH-quinone oxidoreductase subunit F